MNTKTAWAWPIVTALLLCGCGLVGSDDRPATVDASGKVTLDGEPIERASIVFVPVDGEHPAFALSDANGEFELTAFEGKSGAVPGTYNVQVTRTIEVKEGTTLSAADLGEDAEHLTEEEKAGITWINDLPKKYASSTTSEIEVVIPETGIQNIDLGLVKE